MKMGVREEKINNSYFYFIIFIIKKLNKETMYPDILHQLKWEAQFPSFKTKHWPCNRNQHITEPNVQEPIAFAVKPSWKLSVLAIFPLPSLHTKHQLRVFEEDDAPWPWEEDVTLPSFESSNTMLSSSPIYSVRAKNCPRKSLDP